MVDKHHEVDAIGCSVRCRVLHEITYERRVEVSTEIAVITNSNTFHFEQISWYVDA